MLVRHCMSRDVFTLTPERSCIEALSELRTHRIRRAPVTIEGRLVGIITIHDLYHILPGTIAQAETLAGERAQAILVGSVMCKSVVTLHPNDHLEAAAQLMLEHKIGGVPVVRNEQLVGIITESDVFRALWSVLSPGRGCRVILEESAREPDSQIDYVALLDKHRCHLLSFVRFANPEGGEVIHLRADGTGLDGFIDDLRSRAATILSMERQ